MGVVEDIIGIKSALDTEWDDIIATQGQVEKLMKDGLTWWKTNETTMWNDFETAKDDFIADLQALHVGDFEASIEKVADAIKNEIEPILTQLEDLGGDIDLTSAIDSILSKFPAFPGLPNPPADMIKLPELNAAAFQSVFNEVLDLEKDFKVTVKSLNPPTPGGGGSGSGTEESKDIASTLFSAFESPLDTFFSSTVMGNLDSMKNALETRVEDDVFSSLQANVETAIHNLNGKTLTADLILEQLKELLVNELDSMVGVAGSVVNNMKTDLTNVRSLFHGLTQVQAEADSDFAQFFKEVFDIEQPNLLEAVSFVIAIPLTLTSQVTTGQNFTIPQGAFLTFDATTQTWMTGILQVLDIVQALFNKAFQFVMGKLNKPISYIYKIIMGILGSIKSALFQVAFAPSHFNIATHFRSDLLWYLGWGTGLGFSTAQWMLDAYLTKENEVANGAQAIQEQVDALYSRYNNLVTNLTSAYNAIKSRYPKKFKKDISQYYTHIQNTLNNLKTLKEGIATLPGSTADLQSYLKQVQEINYPVEYIENEANRLNGRIQVSSALESIKANESANLKIIETAGNKFSQFEEIVDDVKNMAAHLTGKTYTQASGEKFLNGVCPAINLGITLSTLGFKIIVYNTKKGQNESSLVNAIVSSSISAVSGAVGLYFYNNPPQKGSASEKVQLVVTNGLFLASNGWEGYLAYGNLDMVTKLNKVDYDPIAPSLKVSFNLDVTAEGTLGRDSFVLDSQAAGVGITKVTASDESDYVLTLSSPLSVGTHSLAVAKDQFKDPCGNQVVTSISFAVPHGIESASYDTSTKAITATLDSSLDLKVALGKSFTLSSSTIKEVPITITGSGTTYTLTARTPPFPTGTCHVRTGTGAFQDASGNAVVSIFRIEIPSS